MDEVGIKKSAQRLENIRSYLDLIVHESNFQPHEIQNKIGQLCRQINTQALGLSGEIEKLEKKLNDADRFLKTALDREFDAGYDDGFKDGRKEERAHGAI